MHQKTRKISRMALVNMNEALTKKQGNVRYYARR